MSDVKVRANYGKSGDTRRSDSDRVKRCELCGERLKGARATLKQTKYCESCANLKRRLGSRKSLNLREYLHARADRLAQRRLGKEPAI